MGCLKRRSETWYIQYKRDGKWKRISCKTKSKKTAQEYLKKFQRYEDEGRLGIITREPVTLGAFVSLHLEHVKSTLSPRWSKDKRWMFERYIMPFFKPATLLKNITKAQIEDYREMRLKTVSPRTVNIEINCLMRLFRHAVERDELEARFVPRIKRLPENKGRLRFLSLEEIPPLLEAAKAHSPGMIAYVMLMLYAGLRSGEALALRWVDVDFDRRMIHVVPREDWKPKTRIGRAIPTPDELYDFLINRQRVISEAVLVVEGDHSPYMLKRHFRQVVIDAGLPTTGEKGITAHVLRHTYASYLVMHGVSLYTVSTLLGHTNASTTQIYAHLAPDHLAEAVKKISY